MSREYVVIPIEFARPLLSPEASVRKKDKLPPYLMLKLENSRLNKGMNRKFARVEKDTQTVQNGNDDKTAVSTGHRSQMEQPTSAAQHSLTQSMHTVDAWNPDGADGGDSNESFHSADAGSDATVRKPVATIEPLAGLKQNVMESMRENRQLSSEGDIYDDLHERVGNFAQVWAYSQKKRKYKKASRCRHCDSLSL